MERSTIRGGVNSQFDLTQNSSLYKELLNNTVPRNHSDEDVDDAEYPPADDELVDGGETSETQLLNPDVQK